MTATTGVPAAERRTWRAVALPSEHGGWGLTLEPVILALLIAPSLAGVALGLAALVAFVARTPLKVVLVDRWRGRWLPRSRVAAGIAAGELVVLAALAAAAVAWAGWKWLIPVGLAAPLVAVELWFDMRSRSRRLVPELCGTIGISAVAAAIVVGNGDGAGLAAGAWLLMAARGVGSIPFVRAQIARLRHGSTPTTTSDASQMAAVAAAVVAVVVERSMLFGLLTITALAVAQTVWLRRPPLPAKVLGIRQMLLGLTLVVVTAAGVWIT